eukprot:143474-Rhodomonas_salina.6
MMRQRHGDRQTDGCLDDVDCQCELSKPVAYPAPFATSVLGLAYPALTLDGRVTWNPWRWVEEQVGVKAPGSTHAPNVLLTHDTCGDSNNRVMVQTVDRHGDVAGASNTNLKKKKNKK